MPKDQEMNWLRTIQGFLMDMDGTLTLGDRLLPGAVELIDILRRMARPFLILTNNSSRDASYYSEELRRIGLAVKQQEIFTSGDATVQFLEEHFPNQRVYLVGTPVLIQQFKRAGINLSNADEADALVVGFDTSINYEKLKSACDLARAGLPYIATHPDLNCPTEAGLIPDIGAVLAFIEASTGRRPDAVIGKPHQPMVEAIERVLGLPAQGLCIVGDRLYTDIALGQHGLRTILVLSGEATEADLEQSHFKADLVVEDVHTLGELLKE
jgi:4-nitrophenyl phosphatase